MTDTAAKVTIVNQRQGKLILGPDPDELKAFEALPEGKRIPSKRPKDREVPSGGSIEVTAAEAEKLLAHNGIVDASKIAPSLEEEKAKLRARIADLEKENADLRKKLGDAAKDADVELGDGDEVVTPEGKRGVIVKIKGKKADVKLAEGGEVESVKLADLKPAPKE